MRLASDSFQVFAKLSYAQARGILRTLGRHLWAGDNAVDAPPQRLLEWGQRFLPHYFRLAPSRMHVWLADRLDAMHEQRGTKLNVIGPRGGAKSTLLTLAYALRMALEGREPYIWIVSDTAPQACAHLNNLRAELYDNQDIARAYPTAFGGRIRASLESVLLSNGVCIEAVGTLQRIRGRRHGEHRPTLIICDDLQNDLHIQSAVERAKSLRWFQGTLLKAGSGMTNIVNVATALHHDALALELTRTAGWSSHTFRAIEAWPHNLQLWHEWEHLYCNLEDEDRAKHARQFYLDRRAQMDAGAELLWPDHEDLYALMCLRVEGGRSAFEREKQGSPINPDVCEWPEEYFAEPLWFDEWPQHLMMRAVALDPSKGQDARRADYSAFVLLGIDQQGMLYVQADLARRPTSQIVADGVEICRQFSPHVMGVEANQFQELLGAQLQSELQQAGLLTVQTWSLDNRVNKLVRIRRLGPYLAGKRVRFKNGCASTRLLVRQLQDFPTADHDDGPDALEMAVRLASELVEGRVRTDGLGNRLPIRVDY